MAGASAVARTEPRDSDRIRDYALDLLNERTLTTPQSFEAENPEDLSAV
jgi:hypothetical protein